MLFDLHIESENAAFEDGNAVFEVARILQIVKGKVESGQEDGTIWDSNGNTVGSWCIELEADQCS